MTRFVVDKNALCVFCRPATVVLSVVPAFQVGTHMCTYLVLDKIIRCRSRSSCFGEVMAGKTYAFSPSSAPRLLVTDSKEAVQRERSASLVFVHCFSLLCCWHC